MLKPLNVSSEEFPMSTASVEGMIPMVPKIDNYELCYFDDVVYVKRGERNLHLQILQPLNQNKPLPCIVYIPGSAFHEQNVKERIPQLSYLAQKGFVVAALEYRGSECATFPGQILDAKAGVHLMKEHAKEYNIDAEKMILMGDSSGAHTALMAAFTYGIKEFEEEGRKSSSPIVQGVIDLYAPTNFLTMNDEPSTMDHFAPDSPQCLVMGLESILDNQELVKPTTIANYVTKEREIPPVLMFHGSNDELVPFGQSCELYEALKDASKEASFYQVIGAHHGGIEFWTKEVLDIEEHFIRSILGENL